MAGVGVGHEEQMGGAEGGDALDHGVVGAAGYGTAGAGVRYY